MTQLHSQRRRNDPHCIAWLNFWTKEVQSALGHGGSPALVGAPRRAQELGYEVEVHAIARDEISPTRLRQILLTRSQCGVLFPPVPEPALHYPFDLRGLRGVAIGSSVREPKLHRVSHNHYNRGMLTSPVLRARRFVRVGLLVVPRYVL